jgi:hypothetical protein
MLDSVCHQRRAKRASAIPSKAQWFQQPNACKLLKEANCSRNREINALRPSSGNSVTLCDISQNAHSSEEPYVCSLGAGFTLPGRSCVMRKKVVSIADGTGKTGESIPETGIYSVGHREHRLPPEVTLVAGQTFPRCEACAADVFFRLRRRLLDRSAMFRFHFEIYQLPVLGEPEKRAG